MALRPTPRLPTAPPPRLTQGQVATIASDTIDSTTIPASGGGTGHTTYTNGQLLVGNTTSGALDVSTLHSNTGVTVTNSAGNVTLGFQMPSYVVANLPVTPVTGLLAMATDCTQTAITGLGLAPTGGGNHTVPVYSVASGWIML